MAMGNNFLKETQELVRQGNLKDSFGGGAGFGPTEQSMFGGAGPGTGVMGTESSRSNSPLSEFIRQLSGAKMPAGNEIIGTEKSRTESPAGKMFAGDKGDQIAQSLLDLDKRAALQPVLETEALFKAFGRGGGLSDIAEKGTLGADPLSAIREGELIKSKRDKADSVAEQEKRFREALIKKIGG